MIIQPEPAFNSDLPVSDPSNLNHILTTPTNRKSGFKKPKNDKKIYSIKKNNDTNKANFEVK